MTDDERQIRELVDNWMAASNAGDFAAALALMTDDVIFMTPGRPPFGKKEFAESSERMRGVRMEGRADIQEIEVVGDRAFVRNFLEVTMASPGQPPRRMAGPTLAVFRKEADGRWRLAREANLLTPQAG